MGSRLGVASQVNAVFRGENEVSSIGQDKESSSHSRPVWPLSDEAQEKRARRITALDQGRVVGGIRKEGGPKKDTLNIA